LSEGLTPADLHITQEKADSATAACVLRPVSLDQQLTSTNGAEYDTDNLADSDPSPESAAVVSGVLEAAAQAVGSLPPLQQAVLSLSICQGLSAVEAAQAMAARLADTDEVITVELVEEWRDAAVVKVHQAMMRSASDGTERQTVRSTLRGTRAVQPLVAACHNLRLRLGSSRILPRIPTRILPCQHPEPTWIPTRVLPSRNVSLRT
jgi:hypothetical protein